MKTMMSMTILAFIVTFNYVQARTLDPSTFNKTAQLLTWDFDVDSDLRNLDITNGSVTVNAVSRLAKISLNYKFVCPPNAFCALFVPAYEIELPIKNIKKDSCGVVTYVAEVDKMPVDGILQRLVIKDNSRSVCEMVYLAATTVSYQKKFYNRLQGHLVEQESYLTAELLK